MPCGCVVDIFGASGTGKTQLALQILINSAKKGGKILFLDTTGGFRPERVIEIQNKQEQDFDILERITVSRATNTSEQIDFLQKIKNSEFSLVIIDNVTDLFSYEYDDEEVIFHKNSLFMKFMHDLSLISIEQKIPIIVTNMIRHIAGNEFENMAKAIDLYTHVKIHLEKLNSRFRCESTWLRNHIIFDYRITSSGIIQD